MPEDWRRANVVPIFKKGKRKTRIICSLQQKVMHQEEEIKLLKEKVKLLLQEREERDRIKHPGSPV